MRTEVNLSVLRTEDKAWQIYPSVIPVQ